MELINQPEWRARYEALSSALSEAVAGALDAWEDDLIDPHVFVFALFEIIYRSAMLGPDPMETMGAWQSAFRTGWEVWRCEAALANLEQDIEGGNAKC
jgi:hypothetical protein